jgi:surface protein
MSNKITHMASRCNQNQGGGKCLQGLIPRSRVRRRRAFGEKKSRNQVWLWNKPAQPEVDKNKQFRDKFQSYLSYIFKSTGDDADRKESADRVYGKIEDWDLTGVTKMEWLFLKGTPSRRPRGALAAAFDLNMEAAAFDLNMEAAGVGVVAAQGVVQTFINDGNTDTHEFYDAATAAGAANDHLTTTTNNRDILEYIMNYVYKWNTDNVTSMRGLFAGAKFNTTPTKIFKSEGWNTSNVEDMSYMFALTNLLEWDFLSSLKTSKVTNMRDMFNYASLFNQDISNWKVGNVTDMREMFNNAPAFNRDISSWKVGNVTDMREMFRNDPDNSGVESTFNSDISSWDVSKVTDMACMLCDAKAFNGNISSWDVSKVTNMSYMFYNVSLFNGDISKWEVGNVTDMSVMFYNASIFNSDISSWDVSKVTNMRYMFFNASLFNQNISSWEVGNVTDMRVMFNNATAFNQNISSWKVGNVTNMRDMFYNAVSFTGVGLDSWDVNSVTDMSFMFRNASLFNQNISNWKVSKSDQYEVHVLQRQSIQSKYFKLEGVQSDQYEVHVLQRQSIQSKYFKLGRVLCDGIR